MGRNDQVTRVIRVIGFLDSTPAGLSVREIHSKLESQGISCSIRSVYRDLEAIERAYLPVVKEGTGDDSRWRLESVAQVGPKIQFSYKELMALFIARNTLDTMKGSPIYDALQTFFAKLEALLGPKAHQGLKELESYLGFKASPTWATAVPREVLDTIHQACAEGHYLEIEYRSVSGESKGEVKVRKVGPEQILFSDSGGYLIARDPKTMELKTFAIARVRSAVLLDEAYEAHGPVAAEFVRDQIGLLSQGELAEVEIEIREPMASYVSERRWHDSQVITRTPQGVTIKLTAKVNDELCRWVLSLGTEARVVAPQRLRRSIRDMTIKLTKAYEDDAA